MTMRATPIRIIIAVSVGVALTLGTSGLAYPATSDNSAANGSDAHSPAPGGAVVREDVAPGPQPINPEAVCAHYRTMSDFYRNRLDQAHDSGNQAGINEARKAIFFEQQLILEAAC